MLVSGGNLEETAIKVVIVKGCFILFTFEMPIRSRAFVFINWHEQIKCHIWPGSQRVEDA